jgi:hypothetical protein
MNHQIGEGSDDRFLMEEDVEARVWRAKTCAVSHHVRRIQATCGQGCMGTDTKEGANLTQAQRNRDMLMTRNKSTDSAVKLNVMSGSD